MLIETHKHMILRVTLAVILIAGILGVQPAQAETVGFGWVQGGGGPNFDYGTALAVDDIGNVYATGFVTNGPGNQDVFIQKWDANGNFIWSNILAGPSNESSHAITLDGDGNVYVAGSFAATVDFDEDQPGGDLTSAGLSDAFVVKYDRNGNFLWVKSIGGTGDDTGNGVAVDGNGNLYLTGDYSGTVDFDPGEGITSLTSPGLYYDVFISKFDGDGNFIWAKGIGGMSDDEGFDIAVDGNGNIIVTGMFSLTADFDPGAGISTLTSPGGYNLFVVELDSNGNFVWANSGGEATLGTGIEIALDGGGNIYIAGYHSTGLADYFDVAVSKWDENGNFLWIKNIGGTAPDAGYGIAVDTSGSVYVTGEFGGTVDFDPGTGTSNLTSAGANDIFISKLDTNGNFVWAKSLGGISSDLGDGIAVDSSGNLYLTGAFSDTVDFDPGPGTNNLTSDGSADVFLSKLTMPSVTWVVTNTNDSGSGSLRQAIADADYADTITFDPSLAGQTIVLSSPMTVDKGLTIDGSALNAPLVLSGGNTTRILQIWYLADDVTISGLVFTRGFSTTGGAIDVSGNARLTLRNSTFYQNRSSSNGGAISVRTNGVMTMINSTFDQNQTEGSGGAVSVGGNGQMTMVNSTLTQNQAEVGGGAIFMQGNAVADIFNSTFVGNSTIAGASELLLTGDSKLKYANTIFVCLPGSNDCYSASATAQIVPFNSILGVGTEGDFGLADLADNGGSTKTMALLPGSPLIDAGDDTVCANSFVNNLDQRGVTRPQGAHCDIGAYESDASFVPTSTPTATQTATSTGIPTATQTPTGTATFPPTMMSETATSTSTGTQTPTSTASQTATQTPTATATPSQTSTPTATFTSTPTATKTPTPTATSVIDHDRDTTGVFRPSNGLLYLKNTNTTGFADVAINYGVAGDYPVVGDWDGDGDATIGIYRGGKFYLRNSNTLGFADMVFAFGQIGDQPIAGDWDGDGIDTIGVYRPSTGQFLLRNSNTAGTAEMSFYLGNVGDVGIAGDWDGDGKDTTGVFRPSNGIIFLKNTNETGFADIALNYGIPGDKPVTSDWDGDGIDTIGVYRNGRFLLRNSNTVGFADIVFGLGNPGDMPIAGNWDGLP